MNGHAQLRTVLTLASSMHRASCGTVVCRERTTRASSFSAPCSLGAASLSAELAFHGVKVTPAKVGPGSTGN